MGRPRQFDPDDALDAAQQAFWAHGYEATSIADLCDATGMLRGSLYQAFGDKHALFLSVLDRYLARGTAQLEADLARASTPLAQLEAWLYGVAFTACPSQGPGGCMALNTLMELGPHDDAVRDRLTAHFGVIRARVVAVLEAGQRAGEVRADLEAGVLAGYLQTVVAGLATGARAGPQGDPAAVIAVALDSLRPR